MMVMAFPVFCSFTLAFLPVFVVKMGFEAVTFEYNREVNPVDILQCLMPQNNMLLWLLLKSGWIIINFQKHLLQGKFFFEQLSNEAVLAEKEQQQKCPRRTLFFFWQFYSTLYITLYSPPTVVCRCQYLMKWQHQEYGKETWEVDV